MTAATVIVVPSATPGGDDPYPFGGRVTADGGRSGERSVATCGQLRPVSIERRIQAAVGSVPDERTSDVDTALECGLGVGGPRARRPE